MLNYEIKKVIFRIKFRKFTPDSPHMPYIDISLKTANKTYSVENYIATEASQVENINNYLVPIIDDINQILRNLNKLTTISYVGLDHDKFVRVCKQANDENNIITFPSNICLNNNILTNCYVGGEDKCILIANAIKTIYHDSIKRKKIGFVDELDEPKIQYEFYFLNIDLTQVDGFINLERIITNTIMNFAHDLYNMQKNKSKKEENDDESSDTLTKVANMDMGFERKLKKPDQ